VLKYTYKLPTLLHYLTLPICFRTSLPHDSSKLSVFKYHSLSAKCRVSTAVSIFFFFFFTSYDTRCIMVLRGYIGKLGQLAKKLNQRIQQLNHLDDDMRNSQMLQSEMFRSIEFVAFDGITFFIIHSYNLLANIIGSSVRYALV